MNRLEKAERILRRLADPMASPATEEAALVQIEVRQMAREALTHLREARIERHIENLEMALTIAESDPVYAEALRPSFEKLHRAVRSA